MAEKHAKKIDYFMGNEINSLLINVFIMMLIHFRKDEKSKRGAVKRSVYRILPGVDAIDGLK